MARFSDKVYPFSATVFVASGAMLAVRGRPEPELAGTVPSDLTAYAMIDPMIDLPGASLPELYLYPQNVVMWLLVVVLWLMILADAVSQYLEPSDNGSDPVWPPLSLARKSRQTWAPGFWAVEPQIT